MTLFQPAQPREAFVTHVSFCHASIMPVYSAAWTILIPGLIGLSKSCSGGRMKECVVVIVVVLGGEKRIALV